MPNPTQTASTPSSLDQGAVNLAKAIRQTESGGDFAAKGKSGEYGAYQYTEPTWQKDASAAGVSVPLSQATPEQQNEVAYKKIKSLKDQGYNVGQIASIWNSGKPDAYLDTSYKGVNKSGASYDVPAYAKSVANAYQTLKQGGQVQADPNNPSSTANTTPVQQPQDQGNFLQKAGGLANTAINFLAPSVGDIGAALQGKTDKTALQLAGDAGTTALSLATLIPGLGPEALAAKIGLTGAKAGLEGGNLAIKGLEGASTAEKVAPSLLKTVGKNAALGAGYGTTGALGAGETDPTKIAQSAGLGGVLGGGLGVTGELASNALEKVASRTAANRLEQQTNALKTLQNAFKDNSTATTNPLKTLEDNKLLPKLKVVDSKVNVDALTNANGTGEIDNLIQSHAEDASSLIKTLQGGISLQAFKQSILEDISNNPAIRDAGKLTQAEADVERRFASFERSFGEEIPWTSVDDIRRAMNKTYNPEEIDVSRTIGNTARNYLYNGSGTNTAIKSAMQNESELIKALNFLEKLKGTTVKGGRLGKYFYDSLGAMVGGAIGSTGGPFGLAGGALVGGYAADKAAQYAQNSYFNPLLAGKASSLQGLLKKPVMQGGKNLLKAGLLRATTQK